MYDIILLYLIIGLSIFLIGYTYGRRVGEAKGLNIGISLAPIEMRKKSLNSDRCLICGQKLNK